MKDWKTDLAQIGFRVLADDKPQLYFRQKDVELFIENLLAQQQVSVKPEVIMSFADALLVIDGKVNYYTDLYNGHPDPTIQQASEIFLKDLDDIKSSLLRQKLDNKSKISAQQICNLPDCGSYR